MNSNYWGFSFHVGPFVSAVPKHLEETMKSHGYFPHSSGLFGGGSALPMAKRTIDIQLGIERNWSKVGWAKLFYSTYSGELSGINSQKGDLNLNYKIQTASVIGGFHFKHRVFRVAVGLARHQISLNADRPFDFMEPLKKKFKKYGFVVESGFLLPSEGMLFVDFNAQFQKVGTINMGTYNFEEVDPSGQPQITTFSAGEKSFNYLAINFGLGIRLANKFKK